MRPRASFLAADFCLAGLFFVLPLALSQPPKTAAKYVVRQTIGLTPAHRVVDRKTERQTEARLELLTDTRIKSDMPDAEAMNIAPAKLRLFRADGTVAQEKTLERSRAVLKTGPPLYGKTGRETYLLTVDYSIGMGSYNGPITFLVEVASGTMHFVPLNRKPIALMRSLKSNWQFAPKSGKSKSTDILEVACCTSSQAKLSDNNPNNDFTIFYRRYHWNGDKWTMREKSAFGLWEDDGNPFPKAALFPAAVP